MEDKCRLKRLIDFSVSLFLLVLLSPLFLIITSIIRATSPGAPAIFIQPRIGLNSKLFPCYKFRTMVPNAENQLPELEEHNEVSGPAFKIKDDPRLTPTGRFLRQISVDELPQLFNVLKGEMSLVGPRPLPLRDYQRLGEGCYDRRFRALPGMTCLWQINGRSKIPFDKWMELDYQYLDLWSLGLDLKILAKTLPTVIKKTGAY